MLFKGKERIKAIDGYYSVGEDGTVYGGGLALEPVRGVWVSLHGERRYVSYLVARAFVPNPEGRKYVVHRNGVKEDNGAWNLEWSDEPEKEGRRGPKGRKGLVACYDLGGERVAVYGSIAEAAEGSGVAGVLIRAALGRKNGKSGGFYWVWC